MIALAKPSFFWSHWMFYHFESFQKKLLGLNGSWALISSRKYGNRQLLCTKIWSNLYNKVTTARTRPSHVCVWRCVSVLDCRLSMCCCTVSLKCLPKGQYPRPCVNFRGCSGQEAFLDVCTCVSMVWREADSTSERGRDVYEPLEVSKMVWKFLKAGNVFSTEGHSW